LILVVGDMRRCKIITGSFSGVDRARNEDGFLVVENSDYTILGVFDGVGSAQGAKEAVDLTISFIKANAPLFYKNGAFDLAGLIKELNTVILSSQIYHPYSTCAIMCIPTSCSEDIKFLSLGDSRIYSISRQSFSQITTDHNTPTDANMITKYLGKEDLTVDSFNSTVYNGSDNNLLLCTDGLYNHINDLGEFHRVVNLKYMKCIQNGIGRIVNGANRDDATYIFVRWDNV